MSISKNCFPTVANECFDKLKVLSVQNKQRNFPSYLLKSGYKSNVSGNAGFLRGCRQISRKILPFVQLSLSLTKESIWLSHANLSTKERYLEISVILSKQMIRRKILFWIRRHIWIVKLQSNEPIWNMGKYRINDYILYFR